MYNAVNSAGTLKHATTSDQIARLTVHYPDTRGGAVSASQVTGFTPGSAVPAEETPDSQPAETGGKANRTEASAEPSFP